MVEKFLRHPNGDIENYRRIKARWRQQRVAMPCGKPVGNLGIIDFLDDLMNFTGSGKSARSYLSTKVSC